MRILPKRLSDYPWYLRPFFWRQRRKYGAVLDSALLWARSPRLFLGVAVLYGMIDRAGSPIAPALRSLVTVRISQLNGCTFCVDLNAATLLKRGAPLKKVTSLAGWRESPLFDARERVALEYAEAMTLSDRKVDDELMARLRAHFDEDAIVELTGLVAFQNLSSKFNTALGVAPQGFCIQLQEPARERQFSAGTRFRPAPGLAPDQQRPPGGQRVLGRLLAWLRWTVALAAIGFWTWLFVTTVTMRPTGYSVPFEAWYGNWHGVLVVSAVFLTFVLAFSWPRGRAEWRNAGMYSAFLISLFVEMFGLPLTIYLVAPLLDIPALAFGLTESHLWAYALDRAGVVPLARGVYLVMIVSSALITVGMALVAVGWAQVFRARYRLVTTGLYRIVRHPQYLGLMLIVIAFNIQWPTILTLAMAPVLIVMYVRQARREDEALAAKSGAAFSRYAARVPAFLPRLRARAELAARSEEA